MVIINENTNETTNEIAHEIIAVIPQARAFFGTSLCLTAQYIKPNKGIKADRTQKPMLT